MTGTVLNMSHVLFCLPPHPTTLKYRYCYRIEQRRSLRHRDASVLNKIIQEPAEVREGTKLIVTLGRQRLYWAERQHRLSLKELLQTFSVTRHRERADPWGKLHRVAGISAGPWRQGCTRWGERRRRVSQAEQTAQENVLQLLHLQMTFKSKENYWKNHNFF